MRTFVVALPLCHTTNADFLIDPQNGVELASSPARPTALW
jgi:hypothetical protein